MTTYLQWNTSLWHIRTGKTLSKTMCGKTIPVKTEIKVTCDEPPKGRTCYVCSQSNR